jgi:hypothetical protein
MTPQNWRSVLAELVGPQMLPRPSSEPTTAGMLLTDEQNKVFCSEHGAVAAPCAEGARPPRLTRVRVAPAMLERAMRSGDRVLKAGAAVVCARTNPPDALELLAQGLAGEQDVTTLLELLGATPRGGRSADFERVVQPLLRHPERDVRLAAARALGSRGAPPGLEPEDAMVLMRQAADARVSEDYVLDVFAALGTRAVPKLVEAVMDPEWGITTPLALRALERVPDRRAALALIEALDRPERKFVFYRPDLRHTLKVLSGQDHGFDAGAWRAWVDTAFAK